MKPYNLYKTSFWLAMIAGLLSLAASIFQNTISILIISSVSSFALFEVALYENIFPCKEEGYYEDIDLFLMWSFGTISLVVIALAILFLCYWGSWKYTASTLLTADFALMLNRIRLQSRFT